MRWIHRCFFLILFMPGIAVSQSDSLQEVKGIPTNQVFDLMVDSRGFLWIGHELGLSRFDGISFTNFSCPEQNSLGLGELLEDKQGRIWCRNFSSQIFYVENEKMKLLPAYDFKSEHWFPRMVILGNKLVATSAKGLFVLNTATLESVVVPCGGVSTTTLGTIHNKVIAFSMDNFKLFQYDPAGHAGAVELAFNYSAREAEDISLQPNGYKDTLYSFSPRTGVVTSLLLRENSIFIAGRMKSKGFLNTINPSGKDTWIHMKEQSINVGHTGHSISGFDLSDLVTDKEGNDWYSSFKYGLMVKYKSQWKKIRIPGIGEEETITRMERIGNKNIFGTGSGKIIVGDAVSNKIVRIFPLPPDSGPLQSINVIDSSRVIIAAARRIYLLKNNFTEMETVTRDGSFLSVKNAVPVDSSIILATATGLFELLEKRDRPGEHPFILKELSSIRCRWVAYNQSTKTLLVAFKDWLAEYRNNKIIPVLYQGNPVAAVTIQLCGSTFYISTFSNDLLSYDGSGIKKVNILDDYYRYPINQIKAYKDTTWLLGTGYIKLFDPASGKVYTDIVIPTFPNANIYDLSWISGEPVLLTSKGTYVLKTSKQEEGFTLKNYLLKLVVNGKDTVLENNPVLPYNYNSVDFHLAAPFYTNTENIYFKYRLAGSHNSDWMISDHGIHEFRFSSLSPGHYRFEAVAVHPQFGSAKEPIVFPFTIQKAWYQTTLYRVLLILFIVGTILLLVIYFYKERLRIQKMDYEKKLAIFNERQRISAEIHDDIGAGLSGVRLLTELTGNKISNAGTKDDLDKIYSSITELSAKMKEVVWSLNTTNDSLENLLLYIQLQTMQMMENGPVKLLVSLPATIPALQLGSDKRTDIYLSVKEAVHNALKHSGADRIELRFLLEGEQLYITVRDNGKGLPVVEKTGNGMLNMRKRIARLKGTMTIKNQEGLTVEFSIPLT